jgi:DNA-binding protein H-NS
LKITGFFLEIQIRIADRISVLQISRKKSMSSLKDLLAQRAALDAQINQTQNHERTEAIANVKALMAEHGLTISDLSGRAPKAPKAPSTVAAKYRNQATNEAWSGRGLQPKWLKAAIASGAKQEDFLI